jgi:membrane protease YdiL (CAAX protease family)
LFACALLLPILAGGKGPESYGWKITLKWLLIALPLGVAMGFGNPGGFDPRYVSAILLACMHALATELFFRAYLITTLSAYFKKFWPPVIISSVMYGFFYLTVSTTWQQPGARKFIFVGLFTMIGLLHGYCYKKSQSFFVPWIIHFLGVLKYKTLF